MKREKSLIYKIGKIKLGKSHKNFLIFSFLFLISIFGFYPFIFKSYVFFGQDITYQNIPSRFYVAEKLKQGNFPLWCPEIFCGYPIFAETQAGVLYPLNIIFLFLPSYIAYNYSLTFHTFLAGLFFYLFARLLGITKFASLISSIAFMWSSDVLTFGHINRLNSFIWLPLILYFLELFFKRKKILYLYLSSFILSISFFAGHPPTFFRIVFVVLIYFLYGLFYQREKIYKIPSYLTIYFILLLSISCIQFLPTYELTNLSVRATGLSYEESIRDSLPPYFLFFSYFVGVFPFLILVVVGLIYNRNKYSIFFFSLLVFSLISALGGYTPVWKILHLIPPFSFIRAPGEFSSISSFSLFLISCFGLDYVTKVSKKVLTDKKLYICICRMMIFLLLLWHFPYKFASFKDTHAEEQGYKISGYILGEKVDNIFSFYNKEAKVYKEVPNFVKFLQKDKDIYRFLNFEGPLWFNTGLFYGLSNIEGSTPLILQTYKKLTSIHADINKMISVLNVKYVLAHSRDIFEGNIELILDEKDIQIYKLKRFLPRAYIVYNYVFCENEEDIENAFLEDDFEPSKTVLLEEKPQFFEPSGDKIKSDIKIKKYKSDEVEIYANLKSAGFLVLSDTYYPGWEVYVNGKKDKIYKANYAFRAVNLEAGKHKIIFLYNPISFKIGVLISLSTILIISIFFVKNLRYNFQK